MTSLTGREAADRASEKLGRPVTARQIVSWIRRGVRGRTLAAAKPLGYYLIAEADLDGFLGYLLAAPTAGLGDPIDRALAERFGI
jgi:hypothetical protein